MASGMEITDVKYIRHKSGEPTTTYQLSDMDMAASTHYYGYINNEGGWLIMSELESAGVTAYKYCVGWSNYDAAWTARAGATYVRWNALGAQI
jgi:hypothetical protein